jgi:hypothetical protein
MLAAGAIQKAHATDTRQGRQTPIYVIPNLPHLTFKGEEEVRKGE